MELSFNAFGNEIDLRFVILFIALCGYSLEVLPCFSYMCFGMVDYHLRIPESELRRERFLNITGTKKDLENMWQKVPSSFVFQTITGGEV